MNDGSKGYTPEIDHGPDESNVEAPKFNGSDPKSSSKDEGANPSPSLTDVPTPSIQAEPPDEKKRGNTVSDLYAVAKKSKSGKFVFALVTAATIIGGVAACVQLYDYFVRPKPGPYADRTGMEKGDKFNETEAVAPPVLQVGSHFRVAAPESWMVVDRVTFESSSRMRSPNAPNFGSTSAYVTDVQYLIRTPNAPNDGVFSCQLNLSENPSGLTMDEFHQRLLLLRNGENDGFIDSRRLIKVEGVEIVDTASGEAIRAICSWAEPSDPNRIVDVVNYFFCIRKDAMWYAEFHCDAGAEMHAAPMILDMAKSIEIYD